MHAVLQGNLGTRVMRHADAEVRTMAEKPFKYECKITMCQLEMSGLYLTIQHFFVYSTHISMLRQCCRCVAQSSLYSNIFAKDQIDERYRPGRTGGQEKSSRN